MLFVPCLSSYGFSADNWGANPSTTAGTSVTPGATNAEGTFTQIFAAATVTSDVYWIVLRIFAGGTSGSQKDHLLDIGVDNAGGSSYSAVISNIVCGQSPSLAAGTFNPHRFVFPLYIKSGSSIAVRIQGSNGTAGTVRVSAKIYGQPSNPQAVPIGMISETIGTITNSQGVGFTPGNAADGTWVSLGTTTNALWWWQLAVQTSNGTTTALQTYVELAFGDATNKVSIQRQMFGSNTTEMNSDFWGSNLCWMDSYKQVPGGATLYVRGRCSGAPDAGWNAVAVGMG